MIFNVIVFVCLDTMPREDTGGGQSWDCNCSVCVQRFFFVLENGLHNQSLYGEEFLK